MTIALAIAGWLCVAAASVLSWTAEPHWEVYSWEQGEPLHQQVDHPKRRRAAVLLGFVGATVGLIATIVAI